MRVAGSASWRFAETVSQRPLVALFVRDALGLPVPGGEGIPPGLDDDLLDHSVLLGSARRAAAGASWPSWWHAVLAREVAHQMHDPGSPPTGRGRDGAVAWARQVAAEHRDLDAGYPVVFDPPEFDGLADRPALQEAVSVTFRKALEWADRCRRALLQPPAGRHGQFDYGLTRRVAEQTARRYRVSPEEVHGCAVIVPVQGMWWYRVRTGAIVCSVHAARDPTTAETILTDAFTSGIVN